MKTASLYPIVLFACISQPLAAGLISARTADTHRIKRCFKALPMPELRGVRVFQLDDVRVFVMMLSFPGASTSGIIELMDLVHGVAQC